MNDREILDRLWEANRETPFASSSLPLRMNLRPQEHTATLRVLSDMAESGEVKSGYRIKRIASTTYKIISQAQNDSKSPKGVENKQAASTTNKTTQAQPSDSDTVKGKLLIDPKESLTEANTAVFDDQPPENSINDSFPAVPAELKALRQWVNWVSSERNGKLSKVPVKPPYHEGGQNYRKGSTHR